MEGRERPIFSETNYGSKGAVGWLLLHSRTQGLSSGACTYTGHLRVPGVSVPSPNLARALLGTRCEEVLLWGGGQTAVPGEGGGLEVKHLTPDPPDP